MIGLSSIQAGHLLRKFGKNVLVVREGNPWWRILCRQFSDLLVLILVVAAALSFVLGERVDAVVIFVIVVLNAGIGFFQEFRTERMLRALKKLICHEIGVIRDGVEVRISTEEIVPGDIVVLREGDKIPADGVLFEAYSFRAEESALTGESLPVNKVKKDLVFMGTAVAGGAGKMVVERTGMRTRFGEIAKLAVETKSQLSPLQKELGDIGVFVMKVTLVLCLFLFGVGVFRGSDILESLMFAVSVAIAAVPEGLPTTITIALALGAVVLSRKRAVMRRLSSVETLGGVTTICSDKTGTLTKNEMTVREVCLADEAIFEVSGVGYNPRVGGISFVGVCDGVCEDTPLFRDFLEIAAKCNDSKLVEEGGKYSVLGDPTEGALLTLVEKYKVLVDGKNLDERFDVEDVQAFFPFDSGRKMMSVISGKNILTKGSPDHVLTKCKYWSDGKNVHKLTPEKVKKIRAHYERMAKNAFRVLAFARKSTEKDVTLLRDGEVENDLVFVGLVGMIDPPREDVRDAVETCRGAGVRVVVITGDYGVTANAIARELGITENKEVRLLSGEETKALSDAELKKLLADRSLCLIFARSLPAQKMRIVSLLQGLGEVVAMTGDGVNDAPALRKADIGIAMGIAGTEVSKEAATMVLMDDSFASIVAAVEEGRRIFSNIQKFIWFIFSCNIGELCLIFAAILFQFPLPLTAVLILCVDLGTDILPAIALGVEPAEKGLMRLAPRNSKFRILNKNFVQDFVVLGFVIGACVVGAFLWTIVGDGWWWGMANSGEYLHGMSVAFAALVFVQLVNAFSARSFEVSVFRQNPFSSVFFVVSILSSVFLVLLMLYVPFLNEVLGTVPLNSSDWVVVGVASLVPLFVVEIRKRLKV